MMMKKIPRPNRRPLVRSLMLLCLLLIPGASESVNSQSLSLQRDRGRAILDTIKRDIQKNYYDPALRGFDLEKTFKDADEKIKQAVSGGQIFGIIAVAVLSLDDSHTFLIPPMSSSRVFYGWSMQAVGDKCYVTAVQPGTDAEAKGLKPGDLLLSIEGVKPTRGNLWTLQYLYYSLRPQGGLQIVAQSPTGQPRELAVMAKVKQGKRLTDLTDYGEYLKLVIEDEKEARLNRHRYYEVGDEVLIWKMPAFDLPKEKVNEIMDKAKKRKALILDLRGNGGGYEETLLRLIGNLFEQDVKLGDAVERKGHKAIVAKTGGKDAFKGQLVVLIDSGSGSSAELLARVVQLEKRGTVIGDRSAGAVMRAQHLSYTEGQDTVVFYGLSVTVADLVMTDGKSLEKAGVTPDELLLPTPEDLAAQRDPVLARAAALIGFKLDAEKAGALFPIEWRN
jgi:C-terminal processing protease CtpA/Prc